MRARTSKEHSRIKIDLGSILREWRREGEMRIEEPSFTVPLAEVYDRFKLVPNPPLR